MRNFTLTNLLVAVNVVVYVWETSTGGGVSGDHGGLSPQDALQYGEWWRIFSAAFLHGGIVHIAVNMIALYSVGNVVEQLFGKFRFVLLYVAAIVGSGLTIVYFGTYNVPAVGASGAIFGLFGALVAVGLRMGPRGRDLIKSVLPVIVINLVLTFTIPNISAAGHVGGLITGFLAGLVLFMARPSSYAYETPEVETIEHAPDAGPHEEAGAPPLHVRDPRE